MKKEEEERTLSEFTEESGNDIMDVKESIQNDPNEAEEAVKTRGENVGSKPKNHRYGCMSVVLFVLVPTSIIGILLF